MRFPGMTKRAWMVVVAIVAGDCALLVFLCRVLCGHTMPDFFDYGPPDPLQSGEGVWLLLNTLILGPMFIGFCIWNTTRPRIPR